MKTIKLSILILSLLLFITNVYGYFSYNKSCMAFLNQCDTTTAGLKTLTLNRMIINGTSAYLQSNSDYQLFLRKIELSDIYAVNYSELIEYINSAIQNMELVNSIYYEVWQNSKTSEYNTTVLEKLSLFDYQSYRERNSLNLPIFQQVTKFLKSGDVRGSYEWFYISTGDILDKLKSIKISIETKTMPEISVCWRINQFYQESELFGQYIAEVFYEVK